MANTKRPSGSEQNEVLPLCGVLVSLCENANLDKATLHGELVIYCTVCERGYYA